jgi:hypothetical protein
LSWLSLREIRTILQYNFFLFQLLTSTHILILSITFSNNHICSLYIHKYPVCTKIVCGSELTFLDLLHLRWQINSRPQCFQFLFLDGLISNKVFFCYALSKRTTFTLFTTKRRFVTQMYKYLNVFLRKFTWMCEWQLSFLNCTFWKIL